MRTLKGGWVDPKLLPKGPNGKALCRWCGIEVAGRRRTFCSDACVHEHRLRSDPSYVRLELRKRDKGVSAECGTNCDSLRRKARKMALRERSRFLKTLVEEMGWPRAVCNLRRSWWDADHIVPVVEGGGLCGLENYRTLCLKCHRRATAELVARRREAS
jgi:5-methylcytosine-specific restriction protein A